MYIPIYTIYIHIYVAYFLVNFLLLDLIMNMAYARATKAWKIIPLPYIT